MDPNLIELSTPGEVLREEFLDPMGITSYALAKAIFVDPPRIAAIIQGKRRITADTHPSPVPILRQLCRFLDEHTESL